MLLSNKIKTEYPIVYAVDFDGTLCISDWPHIIKPKLGMICFCIAAQQRGCKLILWTCREDEALQEAIDFCARYGLVFDAVNENLPERIDRFNNDSRKVGADYYIDDKSRLPWIQVLLGLLHFY